ncbi:KH domain-containing protein [Ditylenchus destructor]|nr:KH domain-containing protein [Ditylenchus destructor]
MTTTISTASDAEATPTPTYQTNLSSSVTGQQQQRYMTSSAFASTGLPHQSGINQIIHSLANLNGLGNNGCGANQENAGIQTSTQHQLPGAWFYEVGPEDSGSLTSSGGSTGIPGECSPTAQLYGDFVDDNCFPPLQQNGSCGVISSVRVGGAVAGLPGSRNVTEAVEVPSSEHVAEIVGRQGCKIKALRAKTNTYIKTPVRGEDPVFVVTGQVEDVMEAKREIECAAEHFTQIRASRRHSQGGVPAPGHVTAYVRVPLRVVGLVVGPKAENESLFSRLRVYHKTWMLHDEKSSSTYSSAQAAAQQAAQAAAQTNSLSRPNYGALAAGTQQQQQLRRFSGYDVNGSAVPMGMRQNGMAAYADYSQQQFVDYRAASQGAFQHPMMNNGTGYGSENMPSMPEMLLQQHNNNSASLMAANVLNKPMGNTSYSAGGSPTPTLNSNSSLFGNSNNGNSNYFTAFNNGGNCASALLRSSSGGHQQHRSGDSALQSSNGDYQPWSNGSTLNALGLIGSDYSTFTQDLFSATTNSGSAFSNYTGGAFSGSSGGLSSNNSTSRDEGLGDSPTNSFGKLNGDPYHLMISSIWSQIDIDPAVSAGQTPRDKPLIETPQLATA